MAWDQIRRSYDRVAAVYEARFVDELDAKPGDRELLEAFARSTGGPIVDLGCGPGHIGSFLRDRGVRVVGVDISSEMARRASPRLDAVVVADMRALSIRDQCLGGIVAFYSLIHLRRAELISALGEVRRVLQPGGRVLLSAHEGIGDAVVEEFLGVPAPVAGTLFTLDELNAATSAADLEVITSERRAPYSNEGSTTRLYLNARRAPSG